MLSSEVRISGTLPTFLLTWRRAAGYPPSRERTVAGRCLQPGRGLPGRGLSPLEALDASIAAIEASPLNAFSFTDFDRAREAARRADVSLPFGGVPFGIKELEKVEGGRTRKPP